MDGLLLDSERIMRTCFFAEAAALGVTVAPGAFEQLIGLNKRDGQGVIAQIVGQTLDPAQFDDAVHARYDAAIATGVPLKPQVARLLAHLNERAIPIAVATSTAQARAARKLAASGIAAYFAHVVSGQDVLRGKPAPDVFLRAAALLDAEPNRCVAFEDSRTGVAAALAAGMTVVQVPDLVPPADDAAASGVIIADDIWDGATAAGLI